MHAAARQPANRHARPFGIHLKGFSLEMDEQGRPATLKLAA
jgi:hypothetical protein